MPIVGRGQVVVRLAEVADIDQIAVVEAASWGDVGEDSTASRELIVSRLRLCNAASPGWFWVAVKEGEVLGFFVLQPTAMSPEACVTWAQATDEGRLTATFDAEGEFIYGVDLSVHPQAPVATADLLVHAIHSLRLAAQKPVLYACARMSGFRRANQRSGILPENYWQLKRFDGLPRDPFLRNFQQMIGLVPERMLRDGYPPDADSGGHGVLCVSRDPLGDVLTSAGRLLSLGIRTR